MSDPRNIRGDLCVVANRIWRFILYLFLVLCVYLLSESMI